MLLEGGVLVSVTCWAVCTTLNPPLECSVVAVLEEPTFRLAWSHSERQQVAPEQRTKRKPMGAPGLSVEPAPRLWVLLSVSCKKGLQIQLAHQVCHSFSPSVSPHTSYFYS